MPASMRILLLALLSLGITACAGLDSASSNRLPVDAEDVVVYTSEDELPDNYEVITLLRPEPAPRYGRAPDPVVRARQRAASLGANMLLVVEAGREVGDARIRRAAEQGGSYNRLTFYALSTVPDAFGMRAAAPPPRTSEPLTAPAYIDIQVFTDESNIPTPYEIVAHLTPEEIARYGVERDPLDRARERALELGANAVYVISAGDEVADARIRTVLDQGGGFTRRQFIVLRIADDATTALPDDN